VSRRHYAAVRPAGRLEGVTEKDDPPAVAVRGLRKHFGAVRAVDGVDLEVPAGQVVALLGPNGAGKTTTVEAVLGLRAPDAGTVRLFGRVPRQALDAGAVGAVLQAGALVSGATVGELVRAVAALHRRPAPLDVVVARAGLDGLLGRRTERLSGGQAQRVRFALALIGDPDLLVLDEPTAGLDVAARREFWASVREFVSGRPGGPAGRPDTGSRRQLRSDTGSRRQLRSDTGSRRQLRSDTGSRRQLRSVVFSTHYLEEADEMADRIVLMSRGKIVADGTATAIKAVAAYRIVRCTLPAVDDAALAVLPGADAVERRGDAVSIRSGDSDRVLRALLAGYPQVRDIEVTAAPLADAFLALTGVN
jgi:ABC-2 type transport system ATP-binding protein